MLRRRKRAPVAVRMRIHLATPQRDLTPSTPEGAQWFTSFLHLRRRRRRRIASATPSTFSLVDKKKLKLIEINLIGFDSSGASEDGRHLTGCWMLPRHVRINADAATSVRFLREFFIIKYGNAVKYKSIAQLALYSNNSHYVKCGNVVGRK